MKKEEITVEANCEEVDEKQDLAEQLSEQIDKGLTLFITKDGKMGVIYQGEVNVKDLSAFKRYLDHLEEIEWSKNMPSNKEVK